MEGSRALEEALGAAARATDWPLRRPPSVTASMQKRLIAILDKVIPLPGAQRPIPTSVPAQSAHTALSTPMTTHFISPGPAQPRLSVNTSKYQNHISLLRLICIIGIVYSSLKLGIVQSTNVRLNASTSAKRPDAVI